MDLEIWYRWLLAGHIIAVIFWLAGLYYLPRIFVYHAQIRDKGGQADIFKIMEWRLAYIIMTPAMLGAWGFGLMLLLRPGFVDMTSIWFIIKFSAVIFLTAYHGFLLLYVHRFGRDSVTVSARFFRILNELAPLLTILIVIMVIIRPFKAFQ